MEGGRVRPSSTAPEETYASYTDAFIAQFPYYLSIGMSSKEYWYGHAFLVQSYVKAEEMRAKQQDTFAWLVGSYIRVGIASIFPLPVGFPGKGYKPVPYPKQPHSFTSEQQVESPILSMQENMLAWAKSVNARHKDEVKDCEGHDGRY